MNKPSDIKATDIKTAVTAAFGAAAGTYDASAGLQQDVARALAQRIAGRALPPEPRILEIGCGTGFLSRLLVALNPADLLLTDISPSMLGACRNGIDAPNARFMILDGEEPEAAGGPFDLICSSLAFQWFNDLPAALQRLSAMLAPGGSLMFATIGAESFHEWKAAHATRGLPSGVRDYPSATELMCDEERLVRSYADGRNFLEHLRQIGAHLPEGNHRPLSPGALRSILRQFESGIDVTYHILYGCVRSTS